MDPIIKLIAGLGNPGIRYHDTRHNAGMWFVDALIKSQRGQWQVEKKLHAEIASLSINNQMVRIIKPTTFMNGSGLCIQACLHYFKHEVTECLIVHDEIDLPVGALKLKIDGGHGGHNGIRDIIEKVNANNFPRLRIGVGHPGVASEVHAYVLSHPPHEEKIKIDLAIQRGLNEIKTILSGNIQNAMQALHTKET